MDRTEDDMKLVGFFGIFKQSFKTVFSSKKIFAQITLAFILPLAIVFIVQMEISHHFFWKIDNNTLPYDSNDSHEATALDWLYYALFTIAYYALLTFFSVLSTAAVVFTIASIYTTREVVFRSVMKVIRKVLIQGRLSCILDLAPRFNSDPRNLRVNMFETLADLYVWRMLL
ncbi:hypothetical protein HanXRQr2_Chr05g0235311 [Helianthus annuus]|uniref:Uncharacterized protein n=1 Tax=Helianthus annuus TaxID=4232 RepID=A0A251UUB8_HELAN|nr:hypothetical protein HanXRQr2_Chr05g0235311 [Helianthus annuus]